MIEWARTHVQLVDLKFGGKAIPVTCLGGL
jgi:hypothetical protein